MCKDKKCLSCGKTGDDVTFDPRPYAEDMYGDDTPAWECELCRREGAMDI